VDRIVVPSDYLKEVFAKHGFEATSIANVVSEKAFPFASRDHFRPKILVARMLEPLYNVSCSIRAFQRVKQQHADAELTLLGDGPQEPELRKLVAELGLEDVRFAGRMPREKIASVYRAHDIFLNSSSIDNMPVSILEAYSAGLPVVTTNAGGIPYIVRDREIGHLVPVDDHQQLADRILEVLRDQQSTRTMVQAARDEMERRYRWSVVSQAWIDLYHQLVPRPAAS
jgi:glycosyltransferase involved in cell wall biosynthesis